MNKFSCSDVFDARKYAFNNNEKCKTPWTFFIEQGGFKTLPDINNGCGFETKKAEDYRQEFLKTQPFSKCLAVVLKYENERGSFFDKLFSSFKNAHAYVISKCINEPENWFCINCDNKLAGLINYRGYEIKITQLN